eukprot:6201673-Amphidinium_carterae.2
MTPSAWKMWRGELNSIGQNIRNIVFLANRLCGCGPTILKQNGDVISKARRGYSVASVANSHV